MDFHQMCERAARELPYGWEILMNMELDSGFIEKWHPYGEKHEICMDDAIMEEQA